jgi:hypothetical protein
MTANKAGGFVILARLICVNGNAEAKCKTCQTMVAVPLRLNPDFQMYEART